MTPSVAAALSDGPVAARLALAQRLAELVDDPEAPPYAVVQAARALGALLSAMLAELEEEAGEAELEEARRMLGAVS